MCKLEPVWHTLSGFHSCPHNPDVNNPAYRALTYDELAAAYQQQMEAMLEGGVDSILIETIFDTLNAHPTADSGPTSFHVPRW